jgi:hypothetical protein
VAAVNVRRTPRTQVTGEELCSVFEVPGCLVKVPGNLQVHPEFRRCLQDTSKEDGSFGSHVTLAVDQGVDPLKGDTHSSGEFHLGHTSRFEELLQEYLARVGGDSVLWNHDSITYDSRLP